MKRPRVEIAAVALCAASSIACAQSISDPTRPPAGIAAAEPRETAVRAPVLQSTIITPTSRSAIISGQRVELGGTYADARVTAIRDDEVVLRSGGRTEVLKMYPNVEINSPRKTARKAKRERN